MYSDMQTASAERWDTARSGDRRHTSSHLAHKVAPVRIHDFRCQPRHSFYVLSLPSHFADRQGETAFEKLVLRVGTSLLHLQHDFTLDYLNTRAGSKDTTYVYVQVLCCFVIATVATVVWSLLDRKRANYEWLHNWFRVYLRLLVATTMLVYGAVKIFPWQFPPLSLSKLLETYGDSSPMGLLWTFMGAREPIAFLPGD